MFYKNPEDQKVASAAHYQANTERLKASAQAWKRVNPEKHREYCRKYYATHKDEIVKRGKLYRETHSDAIAAKHKAYRLGLRQARYQLVLAAGGCCDTCGYNTCRAALEFHHLDPAIKEFGISVEGINSKGVVRTIEEATKCVLLCTNCHRELHHPDQIPAVKPPPANV